MSLLDTPSISPVSQSQRAAMRLKNLPKQQFEQLLSAWKQGVQLIWGADAPTADVLAALGTSAAELFALSASTAAFLESLKVGCTTETLALVNRPFTVNNDGSVTLN